MNVITDSILETFFYFRLGNQAKIKEMLYHFSLQVERELYQQQQQQQRKGLTIDETSGESHEADEEPLNNDRDECYTRVIHSHDYKQGSHSITLQTEVKEFDALRQQSPCPSLPTTRSVRVMIISDTHERHHVLGKLPPCDILIHAGDLLMTGRVQSETKVKQKLKHFNQWMKEQDAAYKIVIGGNHDKHLEELSKDELHNHIFTDCTYLCNSGIDAMGLKIWASPSSQGASNNQAFQSKEFRRTAEAMAKRAGPVDILVTHGTCTTLRELVRPRLMHVFGHYHCFHGLHLYETDYAANLVSVAAPIMDADYNPYNLPIVIDCQINDKIIHI